MFEKARALRVSGSKVKYLCLRFFEFIAKPETFHVFASLAADKFDVGLCAKINVVVDEFVLQLDDIPEASSEFQGACESFISDFNSRVLVKISETLNRMLFWAS